MTMGKAPGHAQLPAGQTLFADRVDLFADARRRGRVRLGGGFRFGCVPRSRLACAGFAAAASPRAVLNGAGPNPSGVCVDRLSDAAASGADPEAAGLPIEGRMRKRLALGFVVIKTLRFFQSIEHVHLSVLYHGGRPTELLERFGLMRYDDHRGLLQPFPQ